MPARQLFLAAYDVRDDGRLRRALHVLRDYTCGGQKSVFECYLTPNERKKLLSRVLSVICEDSLRAGRSLFAFKFGVAFRG